jgi:uncharacterized protein (DUF1684 family)
MRLLSLFILCFTLLGFRVGDTHQQEIEAFHKARISSLKSEDGWLNLAGLFWLNEGVNTIGGDSKNDFVFPADHADAFLGHVIKKGEFVYYDHKKDTIQVYPYRDKPVVISHQSLRWFIIKRGEKFAIRLRDLEGEYLKAFTGIAHFPIDSSWRIQATFIPTKGRKITIIDVTGRSYQEDSPGKVEFKLQGKTFALEAIQEGEELFIVFGDQTNKGETYGAGRFIYTKLPDADGRVIIDFNKAFNPPCAFTPFATCPLPTPANKLAIAVRAGEQFHGHNAR